LAVVLEPPVRWWKCPSCPAVGRTQRHEFHVEFHECPALGKASIPLVEVASPDDEPKARHIAVEREDYAGDNFTPRVSAVRTERLDGSNDVTVFAPTAVMKIG
jgi:hypothetical protein